MKQIFAEELFALFYFTVVVADVLPLNFFTNSVSRPFAYKHTIKVQICAATSTVSLQEMGVK